MYGTVHVPSRYRGHGPWNQALLKFIANPRFHPNHREHNSRCEEIIRPRILNPSDCLPNGPSMAGDHPLMMGIINWMILVSLLAYHHDGC